MRMTQAQKEKIMAEETKKIDKATIILIVSVLLICAIVGISIGKILFDIAMANA